MILLAVQMPGKCGIYYRDNTNRWVLGEPPIAALRESLVVDLRSCVDPGEAALLLPCPDTRLPAGHIWSWVLGVRPWTSKLPPQAAVNAAPDVFATFARELGATITPPHRADANAEALVEAMVG